MGKSPGQWLKSVLLGKKPSKSSAEERVPTAVKQPKDKCRWSFGKSPTRTRGGDFPLDSQRFYTAADGFCLPGVLQEQRKQGLPVDTDILNNVEMPQVPKDVSAAVVNIPTSSYILKERISEGGLSCKKREDMAAITIQTAFRGYLARRALKALKGLVRLQAVIRGHLVRRQTGTNLRCVQALVRVQAHARARAQRVHMSEEGQAVQQKLQQRGQVDARPRKSLDSWNSSSGSLQELEAKMQIRQEAAAKRERALAYAFSRQLWRPAQKQISLVPHGEHDQSNWDRSWLEWWMDARHWETAYLDDNEDNPQGSIRRDSLQSNSEAENDEFGKLYAKQQCTLSKPHLQYPSSSSSTSTLNPQAQNFPTSEPIMESLMAVSQMSTPASMLKQTKLSPVKGIGTKNCAVDVKDVSCATNIQQSSPTVPNGGHVHAELPCTERISKGNSWSMPKFGIKKRSFSGPLKGIHESSILGSPSVPNYMAVTQSTKAKARSQSNPKLRPEAEEKTSPVWKRRSLPAENKQTSVPSKPFRSSSANVFSSVRVSRENGG